MSGDNVHLAIEYEIISLLQSKTAVAVDLPGLKNVTSDFDFTLWPYWPGDIFISLRPTSAHPSPTPALAQCTVNCKKIDLDIERYPSMSRESPMAGMIMYSHCHLPLIPNDYNVCLFYQSTAFDYMQRQTWSQFRFKSQICSYFNRKYKCEVTLRIENQVIEAVPEIKFLGVKIDKKLTGKDKKIS